MKRNRHTEKQIICIVKANERGVSVAELARQKKLSEESALDNAALMKIGSGKW